MIRYIIVAIIGTSLQGSKRTSSSLSNIFSVSGCDHSSGKLKEYEPINMTVYDLVKIGKLNYHKPEEFGFEPIDWYAFGHKAKAICEQHNMNYEIKKDLLEEMEHAKENGK